ncbi:PilN domain-containing protein [Rubrimonas cliftonensis]|uniref:General secretion pathway protein L n=1 Tax=Rubrimonas cliftonensis TaxID=89524 RepID=A0A1H3WSB7_9RHOB|nr:PilN domain-containing protein [Rubrimonas cliftonensis]SDZ89262.1 general secretion pathway protein L [Rubrimonas cliftonensis]
MSLAGDFLRWWGAELAALVPVAVRRTLAPSRDRLVAVVSDGAATDATLVREIGGRRASLGPLSTLGARERRRLAAAARAGRLTVTLAPPPAAAVTRRVSLPLAAERDLEAVVGFEMDRLTPFPADALYWRCEIAARRPGQGALDADVVFVPRAPFAGVAAALADAGLPVVGAALPGPDGALLPLRGGAEAAQRRAPRWGARLAWLGAAASVALCAAWAGLALQTLEDRATALEEQALALRRAAVAAQDQRRAAEAADAARLALDLRARTPLAAEALAELSAILPDDAWLSALRLTEEAVEITGHAADAVALVALIDASPGFAAPRFLAPITREPGEAGERFTLTARRAGVGAPVTTP